MNWTKSRGDAQVDREVDSITAEPWTGEQWEYATIKMKMNDQDAMSDMGRNGWELVTMVPDSIGGTNVWHAATVWKRRKGVSAAA